MANSRYIKQPRTGSLPEYLDNELRRIEASFMPIKWIDVTFQNSWTNFGGGWQPVQYGEDARGRIHIRGLAKSGTFSNPIFTLPSMFRPVNNQMFFCNCSGLLGAGESGYRLDIPTNGQVTPYVVGVLNSTNSYLYLNAFFYREG